MFSASSCDHFYAEKTVGPNVIYYVFISDQVGCWLLVAGCWLLVVVVVGPSKT